MYKLMLVLRMLRQRRITWLCIVGVGLGLGALIVVQSVMSGFSREMRGRIRGMLSDISLSKGRGTAFDDVDSIMRAVRSVEGVQAASPVVEWIGLIRLPGTRPENDFTRECRFWGIDTAEEAKVSKFADWLHEGKGNKAPDPFLFEGHTIENPIILGKELNTFRWRELGVGVRDRQVKAPGDTVILTTISFPSAIRSQTSYGQFTVVDTWKSGMAEWDGQMAFMPLAAAQQLALMPDRVTRIHVRLTDYRQANQVILRLQSALAKWGDFYIQTWEQEQSTLLFAVAVEENLMVVLLFLIIIVAGFMIMAILNMIVVERTRDIGIIRALGGGREGVAGVFLSFGLVIGLAGCLLGIVAGVTFTNNINWIEENCVQPITGQKVFNPEIYYFDKIPTLVDPMRIAQFVIGVLLVCFASSAVPAYRAARLDPVRAIQYQ